MCKQGPKPEIPNPICLYISPVCISFSMFFSIRFSIMGCKNGAWPFSRKWSFLKRGSFSHASGGTILGRDMGFGAITSSYRDYFGRLPMQTLSL